jgi:hypothetical protein
MWADINGCSSDLHSLLMKNDVDVLSKQLRHPHTTELLFGFEDMTATKNASHKSRDQHCREGYGRSVHLMLIKLAEAVVRDPCE